MATKDELELAVKTAKDALAKAEKALELFEDNPENNVFEELDKALCDIEWKLRYKASKDCEGSHNCGDEEYSLEFIVAGVHYIYIGKLECEYNRHDKKYYYLDYAKFSHATK